MNKIRNLVLALAFCGGTATASPAGSQVQFIGVDEQAPASESAIVIFNQPEDPSEGVRSSVRYIARRGEPERRFPTEYRTVAVVAPGAYGVDVICQVATRTMRFHKSYEFEAGQKYRIRCKGRTPSSSKPVLETL